MNSPLLILPLVMAYLCPANPASAERAVAPGSPASAAAATVVARFRFGDGSSKPTKPIEVRVDHPFLFAIQHRPSGACLFLERITQPR